MANRKLTSLPELTALDDNDWEYAVDISDTLESPQGTSKKVRKSTVWDYIRGKSDSRYGQIMAITSIRYAGAGQTYTLPVGAIAIKCWINDIPQHLQQSGFEADLNTFTQDDEIVTLKKTITTNQRIIIDYYL